MIGNMQKLEITNRLQLFERGRDYGYRYINLQIIYYGFALIIKVSLSAPPSYSFWLRITSAAFSPTMYVDTAVKVPGMRG